MYGTVLPLHIAIIMDGNGRWALSLGKNRTYGHYIGSNTVDSIVKACIKLKIRYLTLYTFSTENWKRPKSEINFLISLLNTQIKKKENMFIQENIKFNIIGDTDAFPKKTQSILDNIVKKTKNNTEMTLTLALNYGSKFEITQAFKKMAADIINKKIEIEDITEETIDNYLYTKGIPSVDLLIRTGGEKRISNFLLWQSSYAEFVFFQKYWPEFTENDLLFAIDEFKKRKRRFGGL